MRPFPRRRLTRLLAVAVVMLGLTPALQGHAWACSCAVYPPGEAPTEEESYRAAAAEAKFVYVGHVDREVLDGDTMSGEYVYAVTVTEPLKGPPTDRRRLRTAANGGACGSRLDVGKPVLVVDDGRGTVSSCGELTTQQHVARRASYVRAALRGPTMPRTGGADATELWPLLVAAGLVAERRRRAARA